MNWKLSNLTGILFRHRVSKLDPTVDGTRQHNFAVLVLNIRMILIGGTGYTGEMKKGIFTILNYILPHEKMY